LLHFLKILHLYRGEWRFADLFSLSVISLLISGLEKTKVFFPTQNLNFLLLVNLLTLIFRLLSFDLFFVTIG